MQNAAFQAMDLDLCYVPLLVKPDDLKQAVAGLKAMNFLGANVTIPHKVEIFNYMDILADSAAKTGAINTILNENGILTGHNTDGEGFIRALEEEVKLDYEEISPFLIGAGGAARSIAVALAEKGVRSLTILNRTRERADALNTLLSDKFPQMKVKIVAPEEDYGSLISSSKLLINSTPLGMLDELKRPPLDVDRVTEDHVVCDIVYTKKQETPLLVAARKKGAKTVGGKAMLLHQGAVAIHLWTGMMPPVDLMRRAIESK
jgi:shikimate dehydrogenase